MPELPEVEVTRRAIAPLLVGREIAAVQTTAPSYLFLTPPATLRRKLPGRRVTELTRHGKYLLAGLDDGSTLLIHLGMTGQLFAGSATSPRLLRKTGTGTVAPESQKGFTPDRHTHLRFEFTDGGEQVLFRDTRKFGKIKLVRDIAAEPRLTKLGPDALEADGEDLYRKARARRSPVKTLLLDQSVLAGIGNIYADEALSIVGLRPSTRAGRVSREVCCRLVEAARTVMLRSIETGGSSISDFINPDGSDGGYQDERRVYGREGEPCGVCGRTVKRVVIATRSSFFCPKCQPAR